MSKFGKSRWADSEFSQNFRDKANIYLPFRQQFIEVTKSLYAYFIDTNIKAQILDLGCGDGLFIQELLKSFSPAGVTLVDGSAEMLEAAKKRLGNNSNISFIKASFQDLLAEKTLNESFDFIFSSLAIHHLLYEEKKNLYSYIHELLSPGGFFVHYDVVVPPSEKIEKWYLSIWRHWIEDHPDKEAGKKLLNIPEQYKGNSDNTPDTLQSQLEVLELIGFKDVDCYFKYGIFSLFGGVK
jgi:tRNA (cmo5U34)-methyltransferase